MQTELDVLLKRLTPDHPDWVFVATWYGGPEFRLRAWQGSNLVYAAMHSCAKALAYPGPPVSSIQS